MRQQKADRSGVDTLRNHFIGKLIPGVGTWGELDVLRGWKDDFLGDQLMDQYSQDLAGGTITFPGTAGGAHGGDVRFRVTAAGHEPKLLLGTLADTYRTLNSANGWVQICRMKVSSVAGSLNAYFGVRDAANNNIIGAGLFQATLGSNNWAILTRSGGGAVAGNASGIVADTNYHVLRLGVTPGRVELYVDGGFAVRRTANVPAGVLTPCIIAYTNAAVTRDMYIDYWDVIPR